MALLKKKKSREVEIPTSSMADIAFLLLIFFLVTTTIDVDTGIGMTLPPKPDETTPPPPVADRNLLAILVNENGQILLEGEPTNLNAVRRTVSRHVTNQGQDPSFSDTPDKAVVSLKFTRRTPYSSYVDVLDEVWMAYRELWDNEARSMGFPSYKAYTDQLAGEENVIRDKYKAQISIAEPDPGQEG
jgi:biopolymer transport protein ExbD